MRSGIGRILARRQLNLAAHGTPVVLRWRPVSGPLDPVSGAAAVTHGEQTQTINAMHHTVAPGAHAVRLYAEIETGDVLLDFHPEVDLNRPGLVFEVNGVPYVQKPLGSELAAALDVLVQGQGTFRTVLLRRQT